MTAREAAACESLGNEIGIEWRESGDARLLPGDGVPPFRIEKSCGDGRTCAAFATEETVAAFIEAMEKRLHEEASPPAAK
jgi:hypothetical protein